MENKTKKYCFALDLKDDPILIEAYKAHHKKVWPEVVQQIKGTGVQQMEIYLVSNRLFMIMETTPTFSLEAKQKEDRNNLKVKQWEALMDTYQQALPMAKPNEKWVLMEQIFKLT
jgi:L-rhamnose mutarotase